MIPQHRGPLKWCSAHNNSHCFRAVYRIFAKGGELGVCQKEGGARLFVAAGQPQGGVGVSRNSRGARITQGGQMPPPAPPKYTPAVFIIRTLNN